MKEAFYLLIPLGVAVMGMPLGAEESLRILMVGNSYIDSGTTWEQTWRNLEGFLDADPDREASITLRTPGGKTLDAHWNDGVVNGTARDHIENNGPWDYVVFQEQSMTAGAQSFGYTNDFTGPLGRFVTLCRSQHAKVLLFSTWGRTDGSATGMFGSTAGHLDHTSWAYTAMAHRWSVKAAPCGEAFEFAETQIPGVVLRRTDGSHQNTKGAYLAAAAMYHSITGKDPKEIAFVGGNSQADADALRDSFNSMIAAFSESPSLPLLANFANGAHPVPFCPDPDPTISIVGDLSPEDKAMTASISIAMTVGSPVGQVQASVFTPIEVPFSNSSGISIPGTVSPDETVVCRIVSGNDDGAFAIDSSGSIRLVQAPVLGFPRILRLRATDSNDWSDDALLTLAQSSDADGDELHDDWEILHFGSLDAYDATGDPDHDGDGNFEEMVFGGNPLSPDSWMASQVGKLVEDGTRLEFIYRRPRNHQLLGVVYQLQTGGDLDEAHWIDDDTMPFAVRDDPDGINEWVTHRIPVSTAVTFVRCQVSVAPEPRP